MKNIVMKNLLALTGASLIWASSAMAIPFLTLESGGLTMNGSDSGGGLWGFNGAVGDYFVNSGSASTKPLLGSFTDPQLFLTTFDISTIAGGELVITFFDDAFDATNIPGFTTFAAGASTFGDVAVKSYYSASGPGQELKANWTEMGSLAWTSLDNPYSGTDGYTGVFGADAAFALEITINHVGSGATQVTANMAAVPEPATMLLFGTGLIGLAGLSRRKTSKK